MKHISQRDFHFFPEAQRFHDAWGSARIFQEEPFRAAESSKSDGGLEDQKMADLLDKRAKNFKTYEGLEGNQKLDKQTQKTAGKLKEGVKVETQKDLFKLTKNVQGAGDDFDIDPETRKLVRSLDAFKAKEVIRTLDNINPVYAQLEAIGYDRNSDDVLTIIYELLQERWIDVPDVLDEIGERSTPLLNMIMADLLDGSLRGTTGQFDFPIKFRESIKALVTAISKVKLSAVSESKAKEDTVRRAKRAGVEVDAIANVDGNNFLEGHRTRGGIPVTESQIADGKAVQLDELGQAGYTEAQLAMALESTLAKYQGQLTPDQLKGILTKEGTLYGGKLEGDVTSKKADLQKEEDLLKTDEQDLANFVRGQPWPDRWAGKNRWQISSEISAKKNKIKTMKTVIENMEKQLKLSDVHLGVIGFRMMARRNIPLSENPILRDKVLTLNDANPEKASLTPQEMERRTRSLLVATKKELLTEIMSTKEEFTKEKVDDFFDKKVNSIKGDDIASRKFQVDALRDFQDGLTVLMLDVSNVKNAIHILQKKGTIPSGVEVDEAFVHNELVAHLLGYVQYDEIIKSVHHGIEGGGGPGGPGTTTESRRSFTKDTKWMLGLSGAFALNRKETYFVTLGAATNQSGDVSGGAGLAARMNVYDSEKARALISMGIGVSTSRKVGAGVSLEVERDLPKFLRLRAMIGGGASTEGVGGLAGLFLESQEYPKMMEGVAKTLNDLVNKETPNQFITATFNAAKNSITISINDEQKAKILALSMFKDDKYLGQLRTPEAKLDYFMNSVVGMRRAAIEKAKPNFLSGIGVAYVGFFIPVLEFSVAGKTRSVMNNYPEEMRTSREGLAGYMEMAEKAERIRDIKYGSITTDMRYRTDGQGQVSLKSIEVKADNLWEGNKSFAEALLAPFKKAGLPEKMASIVRVGEKPYLKISTDTANYDTNFYLPQGEIIVEKHGIYLPITAPKDIRKLADSLFNVHVGVFENQGTTERYVVIRQGKEGELISEQIFKYTRMVNLSNEEFRVQQADTDRRGFEAMGERTGTPVDSKTDPDFAPVETLRINAAIAAMMGTSEFRTFRALYINYLKAAENTPAETEAQKKFDEQLPAMSEKLLKSNKNLTNIEINIIFKVLRDAITKEQAKQSQVEKIEEVNGKYGNDEQRIADLVLTSKEAWATRWRDRIRGFTSLSLDDRDVEIIIKFGLATVPQLDNAGFNTDCAQFPHLKGLFVRNIISIVKTGLVVSEFTKGGNLERNLTSKAKKANELFVSAGLSGDFLPDASDWIEGIEKDATYEDIKRGANLMDSGTTAYMLSGLDGVGGAPSKLGIVPFSAVGTDQLLLANEVALGGAEIQSFMSWNQAKTDNIAVLQERISRALRMNRIPAGTSIDINAIYDQLVGKSGNGQIEVTLGGNKKFVILSTYDAGRGLLINNGGPQISCLNPTFFQHFEVEITYDEDESGFANIGDTSAEGTMTAVKDRGFDVKKGIWRISTAGHMSLAGVKRQGAEWSGGVDGDGTVGGGGVDDGR